MGITIFKPPYKKDFSTQPSSLFAAAILLVGTLTLFTVRSLHGIHFMTFGDESGHFLGARAIHAGDRLYRDFIDAHGPFVFMVAHAFGSIFGWGEPLDARWAMVGAAAIAGVAVATSSALHGSVARLRAAALFLGLVASTWLVQSLNMVNYHLLGGVCATIILAWLVVPAWTGAEIASYRALTCGACFAFLSACAYSLAPTALLLAMSFVLSSRSGQAGASSGKLLLHCAIGFLGGCLFVLLWLVRYGDPIGYLVFHVIDNQLNYARYTNFGWRITLASLIPSLAPGDLVQSVASLLFAAAALLLSTLKLPSRNKRPWLRAGAIGSVMLAIPMLNFRGAIGFQDGSFVVASIALFSLALPIRLSGLKTSRWFGSLLATASLGVLVCCVELACRSAIASPWGATRQEYVKWPKTSLAVDLQAPILIRIRQVLRPDERLLVLVYNPDFFLPAGYLPMRKFHGYLPWEADYARSPWFGRDRDLCAELAKEPPPVIVYDHGVIGGRWNPADFIPCLAPLLSQRYSADKIANLYIRRDRLPRT